MIDSSSNTTCFIKSVQGQYAGLRLHIYSEPISVTLYIYRPDLLDILVTIFKPAINKIKKKR